MLLNLERIGGSGRKSNGFNFNNSLVWLPFALSAGFLTGAVKSITSIFLVILENYDLYPPCKIALLALEEASNAVNSK